MKTLFTTTLFLFLTSLAVGEVIRGTVLDPEGKPAAGAVVYWANPDDYTDRSHQTLSEEDGTFELDISFKKPHKFVLAASKEETIGSWLHLYPDTLGVEDAEIWLREAAWFRGKVVDEKGKPVADARVGSDSGTEFDVPSDANGRFKLLVMNRDAIMGLRAFKEGYATASPVPIKEKVTQQVTLRLSEKRKKAVFRAVDVEGKPLPDVNFKLFENVTYLGLWSDRHYYAEVYRKTDSEGLVVFDCVPVWTDRPMTFYVSTNTGFYATDYPKFDPKTDSGKEIRVEMVAPVKLGGTIRREDGTPLANAAIGLRSCSFTDWSRYGMSTHFYYQTKTDSQGKYEFSVYSDLVYPAPEIINADKSGYQIIDSTLEDRVVFPDQPVSDFDFVARKLYKVHGQIHVPPDVPWEEISGVSDYDGMKYVYFRVYEGETASNPSSRRKATDSKGQEFTYYYNPTCPESITATIYDDKPEEYITWLPKGRFSVGDGIEPSTFEITGDEPETVVDFTLTKRKEK